MRGPLESELTAGPFVVQTLQSIMGEILRDERVFHIDSPEWLDELQLQGALRLSSILRVILRPNHT